MLRRLLVIVVPLLAGLFIALALPLAANIAQRDTQRMYLDRLADAERFSSLADDALVHGRVAALAREIRRYEQLYGIAVGVIGPDGQSLLAPRTEISLNDPAVRDGLRTAFAGYRADQIDTVWPWDAAPMVVVEPVGRDSGVVAAVITVSSTERLRASVLRSWGLLAAVAGVPFLLAIGVAVPLSRWVLRPVRDVDEAAVALAAGRLDARAQALAGPPELRRFAASFNAMAETVTRTLRRQRTFVSDASHQLRNPLASLRLAVENLGLYVTEEGRETHTDVLDEVADLARVVDSLLALTRVEGAEPAQTPQPIAPVVNGHTERWRQLLASAGIRLIVDVPDDPVSYAPADALGHIIDELVGNAARLSGGTRVVVSATWEADEVVLRVRDDGVGLSRQERRRAGERFWRGAAQQNVPGTGLGLAICQEVIASWGGSLELYGATPRGLEVRISLPAARVGDHAATKAPPAHRHHHLWDRK